MSTPRMGSEGLHWEGVLPQMVCSFGLARSTSFSKLNVAHSLEQRALSIDSLLWAL